MFAVTCYFFLLVFVMVLYFWNTQSRDTRPSDWTPYYVGKFPWEDSFSKMTFPYPDFYHCLTD